MSASSSSIVALGQLSVSGRVAFPYDEKPHFNIQPIIIRGQRLPLFSAKIIRIHAMTDAREASMDYQHLSRSGVIHG
jgi:hypothetical protein